MARQLENIVGDLRAYSQLEPGTFRHVDELMTDRRIAVGAEQKELRNNWFYTADGNLYHLADGKPMLSITRAEHNLVLRHLDDETNNSFKQLIRNHNYRADPAEAAAAIAAPSTITIDLTQLGWKGNIAEWRYLECSMKKYGQLNNEERKLAERIYGQGATFDANMKMLQDANIAVTHIFVLNPEYVKSQAIESPIGRASWLYNFNSNSDFNANDRGIYYDSRLRGVRRKSEGDIIRDGK